MADFAPTPRRRCPAPIRLLGLVFGLLLQTGHADDAEEAKTKANYLYNFTKFVEWPAPAADTLHICVVGSEAVVNILSDLASRDTKGRLLQIWSGVDDPHVCQILYVERTVAELPALMREVSGTPVLTVSDADAFAEQGGAVGFYSENGQIKLSVNPEAVRKAQLKINALLMEIARIVR
ncbi:YfiR family protein [Methylomonas sp. SURF-1]|uniref:YfiR family protein n=1 Tax=Methylomonas aurea TaxID=2952224 RepID=A0ABT1UJ12_9GAMM|nr:YfiR family protein [Methylomonas sp. SURF-1]MCQ8182229.1 YfiR family protein [Methylomonas sp. SURF-1]